MSVGEAGSEISIRFRSGSRTTTERIGPMAPVRSTRPSMIGTPAACSRAITSASGTAAMKHGSSAPGNGVCALGSNSRPFTYRLTFCAPNTNALRSTGGVPPTKISSRSPSACV